MEIGLIIITIISICIAIYCVKNKLQEDSKTKLRNEELTQTLHKLEEAKSKLALENANLDGKIRQSHQQLLEETESLNSMQEAARKALEQREAISQKAFDSYWDLLEQKYDEKAEEYNALTDALQTSYANLQLKLMKEAQEEQTELDKMRATRAALIQAQLREKEIKEKSAFYCLQIADSDIADIQKLENIKKTLNKPRVLSMLIWQTWYQKPLKALSANILGTSTVTGIYKITNTVTNECYIGQAVDVATRWNEHAKCGLGIDTPVGNKLYAAMKEYGLHSFSWELLEQCPREDLNEKERYYIDLYDAFNYGYNSTKGNK